MPRIFRMYLVSKESSFLSWLVFRWQVPQPHKNVESMFWKYSLILSRSFLLLQIMLSWLKTADAFPMQHLMTLSIFPLLLMELPRYLKLSTTSASFWLMKTPTGDGYVPVSIFLHFLTLMVRSMLDAESLVSMTRVWILRFPSHCWNVVCEVKIRQFFPLHPQNKYK